jgi:hypothetical protein
MQKIKKGRERGKLQVHRHAHMHVRLWSGSGSGYSAFLTFFFFCFVVSSCTAKVKASFAERGVAKKRHMEKLSGEDPPRMIVTADVLL